MGLIHDLYKPPPRKGVEAIFDRLDDEEQKAFAYALRDANWSATALAQLMSASGHPVSRSAITEYRRREGLL